MDAEIDHFFAVPLLGERLHLVLTVIGADRHAER